jgi:hypothetical protein
LEIAEQLWRARSRVERHDTTLAEPLLARLFERYQGQTHETALVVAEGLLRCRIARGDHPGAVVPALEVARLMRANVETISYSSLTPVMDEETWLCEVLAPAWVPSRTVLRLVHDLDRYDAQGDEVVDAMAAHYRRAAALLSKDPEPAPKPDLLVDHPGAALLALFVNSVSDDSSVRSASRERIMAELANRDGWREAWLRFALGASLLGEEGVGRQQAGMVQLLHLPVRFEQSQRYLAGLALLLAARSAEAHGDADGAQRLRAELMRRFAGHPALELARSTGTLSWNEHD